MWLGYHKHVLLGSYGEAYDHHGSPYNDAFEIETKNTEHMNGICKFIFIMVSLITCYVVTDVDIF